MDSQWLLHVGSSPHIRSNAYSLEHPQLANYCMAAYPTSGLER